MRKKKEEQTSSILKFLPPSPFCFLPLSHPFSFSPFPSTRSFLLHHSIFPLLLSKTNKRMSYKWMKKLSYSSSSSYHGTVPRLHSPAWYTCLSVCLSVCHLAVRATQVTPLFSKQVNRQRLLFLLPLFHFLFHNKTLPSYFFRHHYFPLFPLFFLFPFPHRLSFNP